MKIDVTASQPHYLDHMEPIFAALPARLQGTVHPVESPCYRPYRGRIAMVAGWVDVQHLRNMNQMIYVEHGAGQAYLGDTKTATLPGYSGGGSRHSGVIGYICPSDTVAERWAPAPAVAAGCPKMDRWIGVQPDVPRSVCFAWHWDAGERLTLSPEMRGAWEHYRDYLPSIVEAWEQQGWTVFGHSHPRWGGSIDRAMTEAGLCVLETDADVFQHCEVLVVDNSSIGYEFALLGRHTIWMNAPWYRRHIEHGLRFWSHIPGYSVDVESMLKLELDDMLDIEDEFRESQMADVYAPWSQMGMAADRAAEWITELVDSRYS